MIVGQTLQLAKNTKNKLVCGLVVDNYDLLTV